MAEFVQRRLEEQLPELEQLERIGLLTRRETRSVIKKRTALEYKLQRRVIDKEDFINYIQYEVAFLELLKKRRQRIGYKFKKEEIEYVVIQRIHRLFGRAINKWKEDLRMWTSHVAFCKKWNCKAQLSRLYSSVLAIHPDKPALWILAAKWEFEEQLSAENARHVFLRSLRFHPDCPKLYQEYFRMELMNAEKQRLEREAIEKAKMDIEPSSYSAEILSGQLALVVYKAAVQKIPGAEILVSLLCIAKQFNFTEALTQDMLTHLQALYADDPRTWDYLARQELATESSVAKARRGTQAEDTMQRERRCSAVYESALANHPTAALWETYVAFCMERYKKSSKSSKLRDERQVRLLAALRKAHESGLLLQGRYSDWVTALVQLGQVELAVTVSAEATERFPACVDLWKLRLEVLVASEAEDLESVFEKAMTAVKAQESLPLWTLMVDWSEKERSPEVTEALYKKLVVKPAITKDMKVRYLDWAYRTKGYSKAKQVFSSLRESRPFSEDFFLKMIEYERRREPSRMDSLRECYERALREFGSSNADLWLLYIKEEMSHPEGKPEKCGALHWRAQKMLPAAGAELFLHEYTMLQVGR